MEIFALLILIGILIVIDMILFIKILRIENMLNKKRKGDKYKNEQHSS